MVREPHGEHDEHGATPAEEPGGSSESEPRER
jgi:hypothetical protein